MKRIFLSLLVLLLISFLFYAFFVPRTARREVEVPYTMFRTGEQINSRANLVKWYTPFAGDNTISAKNLKENPGSIISGDYTIEIINPTSVTAVLRNGYKKKYKEFYFSVISGSEGMQTSKIILTYKTTLYKSWLGESELEKNAKKSLENLKTYMEDTKQFYGYQIERTSVEDTSFLFLSEIAPLTEKREATKKLFDRLIEYANTKNAGYNGVRIFYSTAYGKDKVMLFASIGVSNHVETKPGEAFQYKKMPLGKNLLMAVYQGPYNEISKVYNALENFKADHKLTSMAIPYQKFLSEGYDFADDQIVQMKVYYPVF